jgi:hypothetical protein
VAPRCPPSVPLDMGGGPCLSSSWMPTGDGLWKATTSGIQPGPPSHSWRHPPASSSTGCAASPATPTCDRRHRRRHKGGPWQLGGHRQVAARDRLSDRPTTPPARVRPVHLVTFFLPNTASSLLSARISRRFSGFCTARAAGPGFGRWARRSARSGPLRGRLSAPALLSDHASSDA